MEEAIIKTGGHQYRVKTGDVIKVQKLTGKVGDKVKFDTVLMVKDGSDVTLGSPTVENAYVEGSIVEQGRERKIIVFFYRNKTRNRKKNGHRQPFTKVKVERIASEVSDNG
jgi:large subunit ribosomal protein L21